jgi:hypothetical protein
MQRGTALPRIPDRITAVSSSATAGPLKKESHLTIRPFRPTIVLLRMPENVPKSGDSNPSYLGFRYNAHIPLKRV